MIERRLGRRRLVCDAGMHRYGLVQEARCRMQCEHCGGESVMRVERRAEVRWEDGLERVFIQAEFVVLSGRMKFEA